MGEGLESTFKTLSYEMDSHINYAVKKNVVSYYETFPFWLHIATRQFLSRPSELRGVYSYRRQILNVLTTLHFMYTAADCTCS